MKRLTYLGLLAIVLVGFGFIVTGCKGNGDKDSSADNGAMMDHPSGDHPSGEHPSGEHPSSEHPN